MPPTPTLFQTICQDKKREIRIVNFSDMVVYDREMRLIAIRFGGYPETVQAMTDAIAAGCELELESGGGKNKITLSSKEGKNFARSISHEGEYAESILFQNDDDLRSLSLGEDSSEEETVHANRNLYIFCENENDNNQLYTELDHKLAVPLLPEFKDYFIDELKARGILNQLHVRSLGKSFSAWHMNVSDDEVEIVAILDDGLRNGAIKIPGAMRGLGGAFGNINSFTSYLKEFGKQIAQRIRQSFEPLFDPAKDPISSQLSEVNQYIIRHAGYSLFDAQLGAAEGIKRQLDKEKLAMLVAECGTGKTKIASAALYAHQNGRHGKGSRSFNAVICPSHVAKKWVRELHETIPNCFAQVASSISDIDKLYDIYRQGNKSVYCIISKETARNGPMRNPAVVWNPIKKGFLCPHCGTIQEMTIFDGDSKYIVNADQYFFRQERTVNHKCQNPDCKAPLWSCVNPDILAPNKTLKPLIHTLMFAGLRIGEALTLRWRHIDFKRGVIHVVDALSSVSNFNDDGMVVKRRTIVSDTKTVASVRAVPIPIILFLALQEYYNSRKRLQKTEGIDFTNPDALVFSTQEGNLRSYSGTRSILRRFIKTHQLQKYGLTFHMFRHTFATMLFELDTKPKKVQLLLGHSKIETTLNIYTHVDLDDLLSDGVFVLDEAYKERIARYAA